MIEKDAARRFFTSLKETRTPYFVVGGFAYDGLRGELTAHDDIDLYVFEEGIHRVLDDDALLAYNLSRNGASIVLTGDGIRAELMLLHPDNNGFAVDGVHASEWYPSEVFRQYQSSRIGDLPFRIAMNEVLRGGFINEKHRAFAEKLPVDQNLVQRIIVRPKAA